MKKLYLASCLIVLSLGSYTQTNKMGVVTNVDYFISNSYGINSKSFPFYFYHKEFIADVLSDISIHVKEKFSLDTVLFLDPNKINYSEGTFAPSQNGKEIAKTSGVRGNLYIQIRTSITDRIVINGASGYSFVTKVKVFDHRGKTKYKFKNEIPFVVTEGDEITGIVEIAEQDFYAFYFDGIKYVFEGKPKTSEEFFISKPPTSRYDSFLAQSEKFYITQTEKGYSYGPDLETLKEVLVFREDQKNSRDGESFFEDIFDKNRVRDGYNLINKFQDKEFLVKVQGEHKEWFNFFSSSEPIEVNFLDSLDQISGHFSLEWYSSKLNGKFADRSYNVNWEGNYDCSEVHHKEDIIALIIRRSDYNIVYVSNLISEEILGDIFNVVFAWDFSHEVKSKIQAKANEED